MNSFLDDSIRDRVVIITGGSRGFGWFIAEKLLECGAYVTITASSASNELDEAQKKANSLVNTNTALTPEQITDNKADLKEQSKADENTRNKFPETLFYPQTLRKDMQDVIKFTMMKYDRHHP